MGELMREKSIWASSAACLAAFILGVPFQLVEPPLETGMFLKLYEQALSTQLVLFCIPVVSVLPVGAVFVKEAQNGFIRFYITRIGRIEYIRRKTAQVYVGGVIVVLTAGAVFLAGCFLFLYPLELVGGISMGELFNAALLLFRICLVGGIVAQMAGIFAVVFQNFYMAYGLPFVCYYLLVIVKERYLPEMYALYPGEWVAFREYWGADKSGIWWTLVLCSLALWGVHGILLYRRLKDI